MCTCHVVPPQGSSTTQPRRCSSAARSSVENCSRSVGGAAGARDFGADFGIGLERGAGCARGHDLRGGRWGRRRLGRCVALLLRLVLELLDERVGLVAGELAGSLALREPHRAAGVAEVAVAGFVEEREQRLHLLGGRRWATLLTERHQPGTISEGGGHAVTLAQSGRDG